MTSFTRWNPHRIASVILIVYCVLHSYGALISTPRFGAASDAVLESMRSVRFTAQGFTDTWYGFYLGFGWSASTLFALSAFQLWVIGGRDLEERRRDWALVSLLALANAIGVVLCAQYFFPAALVFSTISNLTIIWALVSDAHRSRKAN
jgi:hypothetical protein